MSAVITCSPVKFQDSILYQSLKDFAQLYKCLFTWVVFIHIHDLIQHNFSQTIETLKRCNNSIFCFLVLFHSFLYRKKFRRNSIQNLALFKATNVRKHSGVCVPISTTTYIMISWNFIVLEILVSWAVFLDEYNLLTFRKHWHLKLLYTSSLTENIMLTIFWTARVNYSLLHHYTVEELGCTISKDYTLLKNGWNPFLSSLRLSH